MMTPEEVDALGVSTDLRTAARALNNSGSAAYKLAADGEFPLPNHLLEQLLAEQKLQAIDRIA